MYPNLSLFTECTQKNHGCTGSGIVGGNGILSVDTQQGAVMDIARHSIHSSHREMVLEHLFVGEVMRYCWQNDLPRIEMLKSQVDNSGYDIVLEANSTMRHIQLKASHVGSATARVNINRDLARKPSGCVIWMIFEPQTLEFDHFLWFGQGAGQQLSSLEKFHVGKHTKANAQGVKGERPNIRVLTKADFTPLHSIAEVVHRLFGEYPVMP